MMKEIISSLIVCVGFTWVSIHHIDNIPVLHALLLFLCIMMVFLLSLSIKSDPNNSIYRKNAEHGVYCCLFIPFIKFVQVTSQTIDWHDDQRIFYTGMLLATEFPLISQILEFASSSSDNGDWEDCLNFVRKFNFLKKFDSLFKQISLICFGFTLAYWCVLLVLKLNLSSILIIIPLLSLLSVLHINLPVWLPGSFTIGEAAILCQGAILFLFESVELQLMDPVTPKIKYFNGDNLLNQTDVSIFNQVVIFSCTFVVGLVVLFRWPRKPWAFYFCVVGVTFGFAYPLLYHSLAIPFPIWIARAIFKSDANICMFIYWASCVLVWILVLLYNSIYVFDRAEKVPTDPVINLSEKHSFFPKPSNVGTLIKHAIVTPSKNQKVYGMQDVNSHQNVVFSKRNKIVKMANDISSAGDWIFNEKDDRLSGLAEVSQDYGFGWIDSKKWKYAKTNIRKEFHIIGFLVVLPGILLTYQLLSIASTCAMSILVLLEVVRILEIPPLGKILKTTFANYVDERDSGLVLLSDLYLLTGCCCSIWLTNNEERYDRFTNGDDASYKIVTMVGGVICLGLGDSFASYVGSYLGRHKWLGTSKSIEGIAACFSSQLICFYLLTYFGYLTNVIWNKIVVACLLTSLLEASTSQIDNLILPLFIFPMLL